MEFEFMMKLSIALLLGLLIGIDRQIKHKPLGLKTSIVICVASCLITIVSVESFTRYATETFNNMDPMRLAAQIVSGVGFLGAGVILRKTNDVISGLTTAAMIWAASGLGIAIGAGFYQEAFYAVALLMIAVNVVPIVVKKLGPKTLRQKDMAVKVVLEPNQEMTQLLQTIETAGEATKEAYAITVRHIKIQDLEQGHPQITLKLSVPEERYTTDIYYLIKGIDHVISVRVEDL